MCGGGLTMTVGRGGGGKRLSSGVSSSSGRLLLCAIGCASQPQIGAPLGALPRAQRGQPRGRLCCGAGPAARPSMHGTGRGTGCGMPVAGWFSQVGTLIAGSWEDDL